VSNTRLDAESEDLGKSEDQMVIFNHFETNLQLAKITKERGLRENLHKDYVDNCPCLRLTIYRLLCVVARVLSDV
jgi:hypothetical protein